MALVFLIHNIDKTLQVNPLNPKDLYDYDNLWRYTKKIYNHDKIINTVNFDEIKRHYYLTHKQLNPSTIIPETDYILDLLNS